MYIYTGVVGYEAFARKEKDPDSSKCDLYR